MVKKDFKSQDELVEYIIEKYGENSNITFFTTPSYIEGIVGFDNSETKIVYNYDKMVESLEDEYQAENEEAGETIFECPYVDAMEWISTNVYPINSIIIFCPIIDIEEYYLDENNNVKDLISSLPREAILGTDFFDYHIYVDIEKLNENDIDKIERYNQDVKDDITIKVI